MTIKITTPNGGSDSLDFGCAQTAIAATVTGTEVSSGEGKLEFKTTTGGTSAAKMTIAANGTVTLATPLPLASGGTGVTSNAGKVLQVVSATKTDTSSTGSSTFSDVSGLSVAITPSSASSKILVTGYVSVSWDSGVSKVAVRITRNGTAIALGDANGSRTRTTGHFYLPTQNYGPIAIPVNYLDSPSSTSAVTYKWQTSSMDNSGVVYVNRGENWTDNTTYGTSISTITVMEIGA